MTSIDTNAATRSPDPLAVMRRLLLAIVTLGIVVTAADLLLLGHYEEALQYAPLVLDGLALVSIGWYALRRSAPSVRGIQVLMAAFVIAAIVGIVVHYRGNLEFQLELNPTLSAWDAFTSVIRAKAPPLLAPGAMAQIGLLGLLFTYRHPALRSSASISGD